MSPVAHIDELSLQHRRASSYIHSDEPVSAFQTGELLPTTLIDEALPSTQADELLHSQRRAHLCISNRRAPPTTLIDEALPSTQADDLLLIIQTSPSLTGSSLLLSLTKLSPQHRRTSSYIHSDEPVSAFQTGGLLPTTLIDEALPSTQADDLLHSQ